MSTHKTGVVFNEDDYAGFLSRIGILAIDLIFISLIFLIDIYVGTYLDEKYNIDSGMLFLYVPLLISYLYLTVFKSSKLGTIGHAITNTKILNLTGKKPDIFQMTFRLMFWILGPINFVFDLGWIYLNKEKRTLRDSICNTIVVKKNANPISSNSKIRNVRAMVFGYHFLYDTANP